MEAEIDGIEAKLAKARQVKQGMMQNLLARKNSARLALAKIDGWLASR